jgi:O-antigen ligase
MNVFSPPGRMPWPEQLSTAAAFLLPGLALLLPSGYSYGAVLLLVGTLFTIHRWPVATRDRFTWALVGSLLAMTALWVALADPGENWGRWDRPTKFALGILCLLYVTTFRPSARALYAGILVGCLGAGAVALWQVYAEGAARASGFPTKQTNAIQWGNLALLMAAMLAVQTVCLRQQLRVGVKALALVGVLLAANASVLSQSRGGWLALLIAIPPALVLLYRLNRKALWPALAWLLAGLLAVGALNMSVLVERWNVMEQEVQIYDSEGQADNSVGQRLEHWRLAWDMGRERPWLGWGVGPYFAEKAARVAKGEYQPSIVEYKYVHNELLDLFVKTGVVGVAVVLVFYLLPLAMFWPSRARLERYADHPALRGQALALRVSGLSIPVLYMGFGLTQVFFAHNSGIMFYTFMLMLHWAALLKVESGLASPVGGGHPA